MLTRTLLMAGVMIFSACLSIAQTSYLMETASILTTGSIPFSAGSGLFGSDLFAWDSTNDRLGVGTLAPARVIDVVTAGSNDGLQVTGPTNSTPYLKVANPSVNLTVGLGAGNTGAISTNAGVLAVTDVTGEVFRLSSGRILFGHTSTTGAATGELSIVNSKALRWRDAAGSTSGSIGIMGDSQNNLQFAAPTASLFDFRINGNARIRLGEASSHGYLESATSKLLLRTNGTERMRITDVGTFLGTTVETGASAGDMVLASGKVFRFVNAAGSTSANVWMGSDAADSLRFNVPSTNVYDYAWANSVKLRVQHENSGPGIKFASESTADHSVLSDQAVLYTKDNGAGKTQLVVRFGSGSPVVIATQP